MRRHTHILFVATFLAFAFAFMSPASTVLADEFVATTQADREMYAKRQYTIAQIDLCLKAPSSYQPLSIPIPSSRSLTHASIYGGVGNSTCGVLTQVNDIFPNKDVPDSLKLPASSIIGGDAAAFITKMGYVLNSSGDAYVHGPFLDSAPNLSNQFLAVYNEGKQPDLDNPDVKYTLLKTQVHEECGLKNGIAVLGIDPNSDNGLKLNSARTQKEYNGKSYVILKDSIGGDGAIETLYHIDKGGKTLTECRSKISAMNAASDSIVQRINSLNQAKKDEALVNSLYARLCPASDFQIPPDPAAGRTMSTVDTAAQEACKRKVNNCTIASGPGIPRTTEERKQCLRRAFPDKDIEAIYSQALSAAENAEQIETTDTSGATGQGEVNCGSVVDGIGWMICPLLDAMGGLNDWMWNIASDLLQVNPLRAEGQDSEEAVYTAWSILRNIANALLIVVFMVVIYGQVTGGMSNYNIKKMLPKIIVIAIAINLSFYIMAILVDIFNVLGQALYGLLSGLLDNSGGRVVPSWASLIGVIVAAGTTAGGVTAAVLAAGGAKAALIMALPAAVIAFLGFLAALLTLMVRQALIPILAILAPIAFVAYILPNTEHWFKKWWSLLVSMLALYPMAALLFGGVQLAAWIIAGDSTNWLSTLIALLMMGAPLFLLPFLARQSGPMLNKLNGAMNGMAGKLRSPLNSWAKPRADLAKAEYGNRPIRTGRRGQTLLRDRLRSRYQRRDDANRERQLRTSTAGAEIDAKWADRVASNADLQGLQTRTIQAGIQKDIADTNASISAEADIPVELKLQAKLAKDRLQIEKSQTDKAGVEASALMAEGLRTSDASKIAEAGMRAGGNISLADDLYKAHEAASVISQATDIARRAQQYEHAEEIKSNTGLAMQAAGIGGARALSSVQAAAQSTVSEATTKAIAAEKTLISTANAPSLIAQYQDASKSDEARAAAIGQLMKVGKDSEIYDALNYSASLAGTDVGTLLQQQLAADMGIRKPVSIGGSAMGELSAGKFAKQFDDVVAERLNGGKISANFAAAATADELGKMLNAITNLKLTGAASPNIQKFQRQISDHLSNPNTQKPSAEIVEKMTDIMNA